MDAADVDVVPPNAPSVTLAMKIADQLIAQCRVVNSAHSRGAAEANAIGTAMQTLLLAYGRSTPARTIPADVILNALASVVGWSLHLQPEQTRFMAGMELLTRALDMAQASAEAERVTPQTFGVA